LDVAHAATEANEFDSYIVRKTGREGLFEFLTGIRLLEIIHQAADSIIEAKLDVSQWCIQVCNVHNSQRQFIFC
jgi:hypothetical protein